MESNLKENTHTHIYLNHFAIYQKLIQHCKLYLNFKNINGNKTTHTHVCMHTYTPTISTSEANQQPVAARGDCRKY